MTLEELQIKFSADTAGLDSELGNIKKSLGGMEQPAGKASGALAGLAKVGGMIAAAGIGAKLISIGKDSLMMANEVSESESLFEVSMGAMADDARAWSEELSDSLGVNAYAARKNVGVLNTMFKSMGLGTGEAAEMSKSLTMLSEDMASFYNLDPTEAFTKLQAGITGEAEGLKRLGILVDENTVQQYALRKGIIKQGQAMTNQQKVAARYGAILEQTGDAQGDLARTMESPTNQLRKLKNEFDQAKIALGMSLQPALIAVMPVLTGFATGVRNIIQSFNGMGIASDKLDGIALTLDQARERVRASVDTSTVDLVAKIEKLDVDIQTALRDYASAEKVVKQVDADIIINPPTTTGEDRIRNAIEGIREKVRGYTSSIEKTLMARLDAQLESGEITQSQYNRAVEQLNRKLQRLNTSADRFHKTVSAKLDAVLADGNVTEKEAGRIEKAIGTEAEKLIKQIQADAVAQKKAIDIEIQKGNITSAKGMAMQTEIDAWANAAVSEITAQVTAVKAELGTLNWKEKTFSPEESAALGNAITNAANAAEIVVDAVVDKVNATWADAGAIGEAVTTLFSDAQTKFKENNEELRELAQSWIDGAAPTQETWARAMEIRDENRKLTAFMFQDNENAGAVAAAAFDEEGILSESGIKNMLSAYDEFVKENTEASIKLRDQRIGDLMNIPPEVFAATFPDRTLADVVKEMVDAAAGELSLENNETLATAARTLAPSISQAINSGEMSLTDITSFVAQVNTLLDSIDYDNLSEDAKAGFGELIKAFDVPGLEMLFQEGGAFSEALKKLGITLEKGGKEAGESGGDAVATGIQSKTETVETSAKGLVDAAGRGGKFGNESYEEGARYGQNLADGIDSKREAVETATRGLTEYAGRGGSFGNEPFEDGANYGQSLADGMTSKEEAVKKAARRLASAAGITLRIEMMIRSPSKVSAEIGAYIGEGLAVGMEGMAGRVYGSSAMLAGEAASGLHSMDGSLNGNMNMDINNGMGVSGAIAAGIEQGIQQVMDAMNLTLNVDGEQFGRVAVRTINETQKRAGQFLLGVG